MMNLLSFICLQFRFIFLLTLLYFSVSANTKPNYVTCGTVLKLLNRDEDVRLHSHDVKYGSGSGQQSVTGVEDSDDHNSYWSLRGINDTACNRGMPIKCEDTVRLFHLSTDCFLHSHLFASPLSQNQEVSCFGKDGKGDTGDYWVVQCHKNAGPQETWVRETDVRLKHRDTDGFLATSGRSYSRPIHGQREVCVITRPSSAALWVAKEGVFVQPKETSDKSADRHEEL